MATPTPVRDAPAPTPVPPAPRSTRRLVLLGLAVALLLAGIAAVVLSETQDPATPDTQDPATADTQDPATADLPAPVADMVASIEVLAVAGDWDRLAELALEGDAPFTAAFDVVMTAEELAAHWRAAAAEQPLADILRGLLGLPEWWTTTGTDAAGAEVDVFVTPRFMHEPTAANRAELERAIGAERVSASIADGQYLGWRLGISADGDWRFFVAGD